MLMHRLLCAALLLGSWAVASGADPARALVVVGPTNHKPGTHEVAAGGRLVAHALENLQNAPVLETDIVYEWPGKELRDRASTIVFIGDTFPPNRLPNPQRNLAELGEMMARGCGIVCLHYATGLRGEDVSADGDHPLLGWLGGYFAHRSCPHHTSIAKVYERATIQPAAPEHPVSRGWKPFTLYDEPYIRNYFGKNGKRPAANVTPLAYSMLPPDAPQRETVAWGVEREDGGRGFGIVMPHFYKNWSHEDLRRFILNGILWTAGVGVPSEGAVTTLPDLEQFQPEAVVPNGSNWPIGPN